jgi:hypothetical protein
MHYRQLHVRNSIGTTHANAGTTHWTMTFPVLEALGAFIKISRAYGAIVLPANLTLSWEASAKNPYRER